MTSTEYLEAAGIEDLTKELEAQGYSITRPERTNDTNEITYDVIATKNGKRVAYLVKGGASSKKKADIIIRLRDQARQIGFDGFRLVVVNPPKETKVKIKGLNQQLVGYFAHDMPLELASLPETPTVTQVASLQLDEVLISDQSIHISGQGAVVVEFGDKNGNCHCQDIWSTDFPFKFDADLNHDLSIQKMNEIKVNTSSYE